MGYNARRSWGRQAVHRSRVAPFEQASEKVGCRDRTGLGAHARGDRGRALRVPRVAQQGADLERGRGRRVPLARHPAGGRRGARGDQRHMSAIRIVIADDHPIFRAGLQGLLSAQEDFEVVGEAANGREAVAVVRHAAPNVLLVDLQMPELDGLGAIREIRAVAPATRILVLTTYDSDADILRAVEAGATGYLLKDTPREELFKAIRATARGDSVLSPSVASKLIGRARGPMERNLSAREIEVLALVARGVSNKIIAKDLRISEATVKTHLLHIFAKLGVDDRTAAVTAAMEKGVLRLVK